jgi:small subunit ribosomal protein S15
MARIYSRKRGRHGSKKPPVKIVPKWVKYTKEDLEQAVVKLASEKKTSAEIGKILRDQYGVPTPKLVLEKGVVDLMREKKIYPDIPEDLMKLFSSAVKFRAHVGRNKKDKSAVKGLEHLESKIRRLVYYYTKEGKLPKDFRYDPEKVKLLVQK